MGRGSSGASGGGGGGGMKAQVQPFKNDEQATNELLSVLDSVQPNILGNYLMPEKKKVGKTADKLMNIGDQIAITEANGEQTIFQKFDKGWFTHPKVGGGGGSYDIGDVGDYLTKVKKYDGSAAKIVIRRKVE